MIRASRTIFAQWSSSLANMILDALVIIGYFYPT